MLRFNSFPLQPVEFEIANPMAVVNIAMGLYAPNHDLRDKEYSISGFPRCFGAEDAEKSMSDSAE